MLLIDSFGIWLIMNMNINVSINNKSLLPSWVPLLIFSPLLIYFAFEIVAVLTEIVCNDIEENNGVIQSNYFLRGFRKCKV